MWQFDSTIGLMVWEEVLSCLSRSDFSNHVKTFPVLHVSSQSQGGNRHGNIHQKCLWKFHQDLTSETRSRLHLSCKSFPGVKEDMDIPDEPGDGVRWEGTSIRSVCETFIKIRHQEPCQDSTCPPSLFLESRMTWIWRWCQMGGNIHQKCLWKFHQDLTLGTMSRLHLSSKSLPGVYEDMDIPDETGDSVRWEGTSIRSICESFIEIRLQEACQDSTYPPSPFLESRMKLTFLTDLEKVSNGREHPS